MHNWLSWRFIRKLAGKRLRRKGDRAVTDWNEHDEPPSGHCPPYRQAAAFIDAFAPVILTNLAASMQKRLAEQMEHAQR
jgi:hypothetical protein